MLLNYPRVHYLADANQLFLFILSVLLVFPSLSWVLALLAENKKPHKGIKLKLVDYFMDQRIY